MTTSNVVSVTVAGAPGTPSIAITASPLNLPYTGGNVKVSVTTQNIAAGTTMNLYVNTSLVTSAPLPASGSMTFTYVAPPNADPNPVTDSIEVADQ